MPADLLNISLEEKPKKRVVTPGAPLSLYEFMTIVREYASEKRRPHGAGRSLFYNGKPLAIMKIIQKRFWEVLTEALNGRIMLAVYPEGYKCRCRKCDANASKNPRGPRPKKGQPLTTHDVWAYRGRISEQDRSRLASRITMRDDAMKSRSER